MLKLRKQTEQTSTLKTIGTVAEFIGKDGKIGLASMKNFKGTIDANGNKLLKKVSIRVENKAGDFEYINCSQPVGNWLRESTSELELKTRVSELASLPILELPQLERDETSPNFGKPIMVLDEETGEEKPLVLYSISFNGGTDMSAVTISVTDEMLAKQASLRTIDWSELVAI